jgi:menaquinone-dependent protoporphyrinogen oxidase
MEVEPRRSAKEVVMSRILLVYGTREGHTAHIAEDLARTFEAEGHQVDVRNLLREHASTHGYDAVIVGASVHMHAYEREVRRWVEANRDALTWMPNAFFSVCLSSANHDTKSVAEVDGVIDSFVGGTGWQPRLIGRFAGAVAYSQYNWIIKRVIRRIVRHETNGQYQDMSRDYDLTDYDEVTAFARAFSDMVRAVPVAGTRDR